MAAAVMTPLSNLNLEGGIMPPSPVSQNNSRHGRGKHGGSVAKSGKTRGRGYSAVDDRETIVNKAVVFLLKRTITDEDEQAEGEEKLIADEEGWVDADDLVSYQALSDINQVTQTNPSLPTARPPKRRRPRTLPGGTPVFKHFTQSKILHQI